MLCACLCYAILNCIIKHLGKSVPALVLVYYRSGFAVFTLLPFIFFFKKDLLLLTDKKFRIQNLMRGSFGLLGMCFWFVAMGNMSITECIALSFTTPLFVTVLAILLLKEKVTFTKWGVLVIGFIGAIIIISPNPNQFNYYSILVLFASLFWASSTIVVKSFVEKCHPSAIVFFTTSITFILSTPLILKFPYILSFKEILLLLCIAILSNIAQILMAFAYKKSQMSTIIPFDFMRLVFASIIAFLIFEEVMKYTTLIGSIIITCCATFLAISEKLKTRKLNKA